MGGIAVTISRCPVNRQRCFTVFLHCTSYDLSAQTSEVVLKSCLKLSIRFIFISHSQHRDSDMRTTKPIMFSAVAMTGALLLSACNTTGQMNTGGAWKNVTGKDWHLTMLSDGGQTFTFTPTSPMQPSAVFSEDGKVNGSSGCNSYFGTYDQDGNQLTFSPLGATRKMCLNGAMAIEAAFSSATTQVTHWKLGNDQLVLIDRDGKTIMTFTTKAP